MVFLWRLRGANRIDKKAVKVAGIGVAELPQQNTLAGQPRIIACPQ